VEEIILRLSEWLSPPSAGERPELYKRAGRRYTPEDIARRKEFDEEFNLWLEEVRMADC